MKYKPKKLKIVGFDIETTGLEELSKYKFEKGNIVNNPTKDSVSQNPHVIVDGKVYEYDYINIDEENIKLRSGNKIITINKTHKEVEINEVPFVTGYGYITYEISTPEYDFDKNTKTLSLSYDGETKEFSYKTINYELNKKTGEREIKSFVDSDNNLFVIKDGLIFQRSIKNSKITDTPLYDYFKKFEKLKEKNLVFSIPEDAKISPEACALTRLYQKQNLLNITNREEISDWLFRFKKKIDSEEKNRKFPDINLNQPTNKIWEDFFEAFEDYNPKEISKYPRWKTEKDYEELLSDIEWSDITFGHNIFSFDINILSYHDERFFHSVKNNFMFDTMLIPIKSGKASIPKNLNKALNEVIDKSKLFDEKEKERIVSLQEEREKYHDALLDIDANFYLFADQLQFVYSEQNTNKYKQITKVPVIKSQPEPTKIPEIKTLIGVSTDINSFSSIDKITDIAKENGYDNISVSNTILNDFNKNNDTLKENGKKSIVSLRIKLEGEDLIVVLKNPKDQIIIEMFLDSERDLTLEQFQNLLKIESTIDFLVKPDFEQKYNITNEKIYVRFDPFISFDYENFESQNKRILTVSPLTDENNMDKYISGVTIDVIRNNGIFTGEIDHLKLLNLYENNNIVGIPTKEQLSGIFPYNKYKDIYRNADKLAEQSVEFDLYSTNKREEFPDLEKLFNFKVPEIDEDIVQKSIDELNFQYSNKKLSFSRNGMSYKINGSLKEIGKEKSDIEEHFKKILEKNQWQKHVQNDVDNFMSSNKFKATIYNRILLNRKISIMKTVPKFSNMTQEEKIKNILTYTEQNVPKEELENEYNELYKEYEERQKMEMDVFGGMLLSENELNTELSIFYFKYLTLMKKVIVDIYSKYGIVIGPGRGSVGGSFVAYAMEITTVDPITQGTIFPRFVHKFKKGKPDIDTDHNDRQKAIDAIESYTKEFYFNEDYFKEMLGVEDLSSLPEHQYFKNILNVVYFSRKTIFAGLAKALRINALQSKILQQNIDDTKSLKENIDSIVNQRLKSYFDKIPDSILDMLDENLENMIRNMGKHASGNILFNHPFEKVYTDKNMIEHYGEDGFMPEKLDILGLQTLENMIQFKISATVHDINKTFSLGLTNYDMNDFIKKYDTSLSFIENFDLILEGVHREKGIEDIELTNIYNSYEPDYFFPDLKNPKIISMLKNKFNGGIFQMDAKTQQKLGYNLFSILELGLKEDIPSFSNIDIQTILTIINAVNRPGPLMAGMGEEIVINFRNLLIQGLYEKGNLDNYEDNEYLKNHIRNFKKEGNITKEYYESGRFFQFWETNIEEERKNIANGNEPEGLIGRLITEGKTNYEIIEIFKSFEKDIKGVEAVQNILESSIGTILYQEQIMQLSQELGGLNDTEGEDLRKAVAKGKNIMESINKFVNGAEGKKLITKDQAEYLGIKFKGFGSYAFNLAHSAAYAQLGYQTADQKVRNPALFYATSFNFSKMESVANMIKEIESTKTINLAIPDINKSFDLFTVEGNEIIIPITAYKGVSEEPANKVIEELRKNGPFTSMYNFLDRTLPEMDKTTFEVLIKAGLMDNFIKPFDISVKSITENFTLFFEQFKDFYFSINPKYTDISLIETKLKNVEAEIEILEKEQYVYSNQDEIILKLNTLIEKRDKYKEDIVKGQRKNEKIIKEKSQKDLFGNNDEIKDYNLSEMIEIIKTRIDVKVEKAETSNKKNNNSRSKKQLENIKKKKESFLSLIEDKEDYSVNDMNINRYALLKNYSIDNVTKDVDNLPVMSEETIENIIKLSSHQFDGSNYRPFTELLKEKYEVDISFDLSKPLYKGKSPKILFFHDYVPDKKDFVIHEFEFDGKLYRRNSPDKPFYSNVSNPRDSMWFAFNKDTKQPELYYKNRNKEKVMVNQNKYIIKKQYPEYLSYFKGVLQNNGYSLDDIMVLPAFPLKQSEYKSIEDKGISINFTDSVFTSRLKNILMENEIEMAVFTNTMNNSVTRRWNLAGQETSIDVGKPYIFNLSGHLTTCLQIPTTSENRRNKDIAINAFANILPEPEEKEPDILEEQDRDIESKQIDNSKLNTQNNENERKIVEMETPTK